MGRGDSRKPNISLRKSPLPRSKKGLREVLPRATPPAVRSERLSVCKSVIYHSLWPVFPGRRKKGLAGHLFFVLKSSLKNNNKVLLNHIVYVWLFSPRVSFSARLGGRTWALHLCRLCPHEAPMS